MSSSLEPSGSDRTAERRLCIVADDFGLHPGIDSAILELVDAGRIQALSCMTGGRSWMTSARAIANNSPVRPDVGLHLDLTECPIGQARQGLGSLLLQAYARSLNRVSLRREIRQQLSAFEAALGRAPDYVDGHQHVHQLPRIRDELVEELAERYPAGERPWLRLTATPPYTSGRRSFAGLPIALRVKAALIARLGSSALQRRASGLGFAMNSALLGVYGFDAEQSQYRALLELWLASAPDQALLMCHPAQSIESGDPIAHARLNEYAVLAGSEFPDLLVHHRIRAMPMREILRVTDHSSSIRDEDALPDTRDTPQH